MLDVRPVLYVDGLLLLVLAVAMLFPMGLEAVEGRADWQVFLASALVTGFAGAGLALGSRPTARLALSTRQAFLLTALTWIFTAGFAALPFMFSALAMSFTDGYFEAMSGLTTTGATVIRGLDTVDPGILLWRAILHWLGGIAVIVMAVAVLPTLRIGGMQLFRMESSDKTAKVRPRVSQVATTLVTMYALLTALCTLCLYLAGMTWLEAVCHAFAALSTGGFSTSDTSIGHFDSAGIEWIITLFMIVGGGSFVLYIAPWRHGRWALLHDSQVGWYLRFIAFFSGLMAFWQWAVNDMAPLDAVRHGIFAIASAVTTTGFAADDYTRWGGFAAVTLFILAFIGGCTGSSAGGIKIFRWEVLFAMCGRQMRHLLHPHGVFAIDFNRQTISDAVVRSVLGFMVLYFFAFAGLSIGLTAMGLDLVASLTAAATALGNAAPGLVPAAAVPLPDGAKWLLAFGMLLGRLELFAVLVLFMPSFWKA